MSVKIKTGFLYFRVLTKDNHQIHPAEEKIMRKFIVYTSIIFISITSGTAQDLIIKRNTEEIPAKVFEVTPTEIKYKRADHLDGPTFIIPKSEVFMIRYENGTNDIFYAENPEPETPAMPESKTKAVIAIPSSPSLYTQGLADASRYYNGYKASSTTVLLVGLLSPIVGLVPAIACSSKSPAEKNLNYPNQELMNKSEYYEGYTKRSKRIKQGKIWSNLGIAFGANVAAILVLAAGR